MVVRQGNGRTVSTSHPVYMKRQCWVFVLGDFGRSPRMQYHTESLLNKGLDVTVIAFPGSAPLPSIHTHSNISFASIPTVPTWLHLLPTLIHLCLKAVFQLVSLLLMMLIQLPQPDFVLVQIPPAIPTLFVCAAVRVFRRTKIVFDWHNFAYTLMQLNSKTPSLLVIIARWIEIYGGRWTKSHFCVSMAMCSKLKEWGMEATVVYDRSHKRYQQSSLEQTHTLFQKLRTELKTPMHPEDIMTEALTCLSDEETLLTTMQDGSIKERSSRPAVIVSSTSWTPDEDFSILLSALEFYDRQSLQPSTSHPQLLVCITGKGHLKQHYVQKMQQMKFNKVAVRTLWLDPEDYPLLLGSADLGISLHTSSSGVDLPMKIVDMFGCDLPVCSIDYPAIGELVHSGMNGVLFTTPEELCSELLQLLDGFPFHPDGQSQLMQMRRQLQSNKESDWDAYWNQTAWPKLAAVADVAGIL